MYVTEVYIYMYATAVYINMYAKEVCISIYATEVFFCDFLVLFVVVCLFVFLLRI